MLYLIFQISFEQYPYIPVIYNAIVPGVQQLQWLNFGQVLHSRTTTHISPSRASYGVSFVRSSKENDCDISGGHCIFNERGDALIANRGLCTRSLLPHILRDLLAATGAMAWFSSQPSSLFHYQDRKVHGANMGPTKGRQYLLPG